MMMLRLTKVNERTADITNTEIMKKRLRIFVRPKDGEGVLETIFFFHWSYRSDIDRRILYLVLHCPVISTSSVMMWNLKRSFFHKKLSHTNEYVKIHGYSPDVLVDIRQMF